MGACVGEHGYMYMYGWVSSLFTWNYHNIITINIITIINILP